MNVIENQQLWFDNVLSYRTRVEKDSLGDMIKHICDNISVLGLEITDNIVLTVSEETEESKQTILGVEVIIPVNKPFKSNCHYIFKPHFRLENAVLFTYCGNVGGLPKMNKRLREYALSRQYSPLTGVYFSIKQICGNEIVANAYMGINGNLL